MLFRSYLALPLTWEEEEKIGGDWVVTRSAPLIIEAGSRHPRLQRAHGRSRVLVAKEPFPYRYIGDDCVIFFVLEQRQIRAACGDVPPVKVTDIADSGENPDLHWGALWNAIQNDSLRVNGQTISWADIRLHARAGKSFPQDPNKQE